MSNRCYYCGARITPLNYAGHGSRSDQCISTQQWLAKHGFISAVYKIDTTENSRRVRELL